MSIKHVVLLSVFYIFLIIVLSIFDYSESKLTVTFFDVGQGDSAYIEFPNRQTMLIDGGEDNTVSYKLNNKSIFPFCKINYLIATHAHLDHVGGFKKILQNCFVDSFTFNDIDCNSKTCNYFLQNFERNSLLKGDLLTIGDVKVKVLWPDPKNDNIDYSNLNNTSIVLFLDYGTVEALFTGDAEQDSLKSLDWESIYPDIDDGLDLLKVSHHGSYNGLYKEPLVVMKPKNCIISVGKDNSYGHPSPKVVTTLKDLGCNVLRTDEIGDISFIF